MSAVRFSLPRKFRGAPLRRSGKEQEKAVQADVREAGPAAQDELGPNRVAGQEEGGGHANKN